MLFCDGQSLGVRSDYNGVLLLDSILQKTLRDSKEEVKLELPLSEVKLISLVCICLITIVLIFQAIILKQSLTSGSNSGYDHVINKLTEIISNAQAHHKKGIKAQKV